MFFEKIKIEYKALIVLSFYVFWLISFPMSGFLVAWDISHSLTNYFLLFHVLTFVISYFFINMDVLKKLTNPAILITAILTFVFPFFKEHNRIIISIIGVTSVFLAIKSILIFKKVSDKIIFSVFSLVLGNLLTFITTSFNKFLVFFLISLCLITITFITLEKDYEKEVIEIKIIKLFILFIFYLTGGLMYEFFLPNYLANAYIPNSELIFYILGLLISIYFIKKDLEIAFAIGLLFGNFSFFLYKIQTTPFINAGMYISQISFGIVDAFFLNLIISYITDFKKTLVIFIAMLSGILSGKLICTLFQNKLGIIIESGNLFLILSAILLFFNIKIEKKVLTVEASIDKKAKNIQEIVFDENNSYKKLSEQEKKVLEKLLQNKSYKTIAEEMNISISTVKTYMKRIYEKTNIRNIDDLKNKFKKE